MQQLTFSLLSCAVGCCLRVKVTMTAAIIAAAARVDIGSCSLTRSRRHPARIQDSYGAGCHTWVWRDDGGRRGARCERHVDHYSLVPARNERPLLLREKGGGGGNMTESRSNQQRASSSPSSRVIAADPAAGDPPRQRNRAMTSISSSRADALRIRIEDAFRYPPPPPLPPPSRRRRRRRVGPRRRRRPIVDRGHRDDVVRRASAVVVVVVVVVVRHRGGGGTARSSTTARDVGRIGLVPPRVGRCRRWELATTPAR